MQEAASNRAQVERKRITCWGNLRGKLGKIGSEGRKRATQRSASPLLQYPDPASTPAPPPPLYLTVHTHPLNIIIMREKAPQKEGERERERRKSEKERKKSVLFQLVKGLCFVKLMVRVYARLTGLFRRCQARVSVQRQQPLD